jgi:hypothetical protein
VISLHPPRTREDAETSRLNRNGWIVVVLAALLLSALVALAERRDPQAVGDAPDPAALID